MKNKCAYSTCDNSYFIYSLISLISVKKWNPTYDLYIITSKLNDKNKRLAQSYEVDVIELDLTSYFYKEWDYPKECFYLFAGPKVLSKKGYSFSIYIDGDVLCNREINIDWKSIEYFAGTSHRSMDHVFGGDINNIFKVFDIESVPSYRIQSGVIFFNNQKMAGINLLSRVAKLFKSSLENNIPRKGDDSLFALFQLVHSKVQPSVLSRKYNTILPGNARESDLLVDGSIIRDCVFFHFTSGCSKPWIKDERSKTPVERYFRKKWQELLVNSLDLSTITEEVPSFDNFNDDFLGFYWWDGQNVGDLVTPYFLREVCGYDDLEDFYVPEDKLPPLPSKVDRLLSFFITRAPERRVDAAISCGSIMRLARPGVSVYGSGIRDRDQHVRQAQYHSVRGPLTRARILEAGFDCPPIYGDPALLLSRYYTPTCESESAKLGIMPHLSDYDDVLSVYTDINNVKIINMECGDIEHVIEEMVTCDYVISSSLHGIIFANSYSKPVRWIKFSDRVYGDDTKFYDHFHAIGRPEEDFIDAREFKYVSVDDLCNMVTPYEIDFNLDRLQDALFFDEKGIKPSLRWIGLK